MKIKVTREEIERAYRKLNKCPCCGYEGIEPHTCACNPEVFENRLQEVEVEGIEDCEDKEKVKIY